MDSYSIKILGGNLSGVCDKCGKQSSGLYSADICAGEKTRRMVLCEDCLKKLNSFVERKNSEIQSDTIVSNISGISEFPVSQSPTYLDTARNYTGDGVVCPECGNSLPAGAAFCKRCGSAVFDYNKPKRQKRKMGDSAFIRKLSPKVVIIPDILLIIISVVRMIISLFEYKSAIIPFYIVGLLITVLAVALRLLNISAVVYNAPLKTVAFVNLSLAVTVLLIGVNEAFSYSYRFSADFSFAAIWSVFFSNLFWCTTHIVFSILLMLLSSEKTQNTRFGLFLTRLWVIIPIISALILIPFPTASNIPLLYYYLFHSMIPAFIDNLISIIFHFIRYFLITAYFIKRIRYGKNEPEANQFEDAVQNNYRGMTI